MLALSKTIQNRLKTSGSKVRATGQQKYFKNVVQCRGLTAKELSNEFANLYKSDVQSLELDSKIELASTLMASDFLEDKCFAIKILNKNHKELTADHLPIFQSYYEKGHVHDWATADTLCGKVFFEMIKRNREISNFVKGWKNHQNLWLQRTSCVSFVKLARHGDFNDEIFDICGTTVKSKERFVQLGNGWVLRELSTIKLKEVTKFIKTNYQYFSREGLRYAIEKMSGDLKTELLGFGKEATKDKKRKTSPNQKKEAKNSKKQRIE